MSVTLLLTGSAQAGASWSAGAVGGSFARGAPGPFGAQPRLAAAPRMVQAPALRQAQGDAWHIETVDGAGNVGYGNSLALDATGLPRISYIDWTNKALKYAYYDGSGWIVETVSDPGYIVGGASLALDDQDWPHIAYCAGEEGYNYCLELRYARRDATTWYTETVDSGGTIDDGSGASLALDAAGRPHIAYRGCGGLCYASHDGTGWITQTVMQSGHGVGAISLALDAAGRPHISYADLWDLMYARYDGTQWTFDRVGYMGDGSTSSLALDQVGRPRIAYESGEAPYGIALKYASHDDQAWHIEVVDQRQYGQYIGGGSSLVLDAFDHPHISYNYDFTAVRYAHCDGVAWWIEAVDDVDAPNTSLALDASGCPHIVYGGGDLKYAYRTCTPVGGAAIAGLARLPVGATGFYTATAGPLDATPPVTLTWADGTVSATRPYSWTEAGLVSLAVTATNVCGQARGALTVTVCLPLAGVVISGPTMLYAGQPGTYYAAPQPLTATPPLTYSWDNGTVGPTATYSWAMTGTRSLAVTANNDCGSTGSAALQIQIVAWPYGSYLPVLWRE